MYERAKLESGSICKKRDFLLKSPVTTHLAWQAPSQLTSPIAQGVGGQERGCQRARVLQHPARTWVRSTKFTTTRRVAPQDSPTLVTWHLTWLLATSCLIEEHAEKTFQTTGLHGEPIRLDSNTNSSYFCCNVSNWRTKQEVSASRPLRAASELHRQCTEVCKTGHKRHRLYSFVHSCLLCCEI